VVSDVSPIFLCFSLLSPGNFAKFFNGGKPFVDDLVLEITDSGAVEVRSSSRVGDSDMGVNQNRLNFLASNLRAAGWTAPEPKY
jgi:hypothetical protein